MTKSRRWFYILFPLACFVVFAYPVNRLVNWTSPAAFSITHTVLLWLFATFALWYSFRSPKMVVRYILVHWMGASFILLALILIYEVIRFFTSLPDPVATIWIVGIGAGLVVFALLASHFIRVKPLQFTSEKITRPCRVVQISDVHIGSRQGGYLTRIVGRINSLRPDVVVITGDLLDSAAVGYDDLQSLQQLNAKVLLSIGNHERYADLDKALSILEKLGVQVLRQQHVQLGEIQFIGIDDADEPGQVADKLPAIMRGVAQNTDCYTILMYHRPLGWEAAIAHGIDLMLCGHTHNGQIFPFNMLVKQQFNRICGLYCNRDQGAQSSAYPASAYPAYLYVSPGTGTWGPLMRLGSLNEITCIDIAPGAEANT